jgi:hypothetical protein
MTYDTTPKTWPELKPPGYWADGRFVPVREMTAEDIEDARERWLDWFGYVPDVLKRG